MKIITPRMIEKLNVDLSIIRDFAAAVFFGQISINLDSSSFFFIGISNILLFIFIFFKVSFAYFAFYCFLNKSKVNKGFIIAKLFLSTLSVLILSFFWIGAISNGSFISSIIIVFVYIFKIAGN